MRERPDIPTETTDRKATTIIVGGGLAGACAAFTLSRAGERVRLLEARKPGAGASGAAAGLVNPFMGRRARPSWRFEEALDALHALLEAAGQPRLFRPTGVLRPAQSEKQAGFFRATAEARPTHAAWLEGSVAEERHHEIAAPHGALWAPGGGAVDVPAMIRALLTAAEEHGAEVQTGTRVTGWDENAGGAFVDVGRKGGTERLRAARVMLALGQGYPGFAELKELGLRSVKGQTVRVRRPAGLDALPACSGAGYVVPEPAPAQAGSDTLIVGSSYEHDFEDLTPNPAVTERILTRAARMLPALDGAKVIEERAGARVSPPSSHLPIVGLLPERERTWTFTGLGSRGLLTAPLLARALPRFLTNREAIPEAVRMPTP